MIATHEACPEPTVRARGESAHTPLLTLHSPSVSMTAPGGTNAPCKSKLTRSLPVECSV
jgi:hypothetical protein